MLRLTVTSFLFATVLAAATPTTYNVLDYGAKNDGSARSTEAIQKAIQAAAKAGAGRLDPSYGKGGVTTTAFGVAGEESDAELTLGPQGSALVANGIQGIAARFGANGSWDTHFGKAVRQTR